jgi:nitrous oxide reductase accessory protein NosL
MTMTTTTTEAAGFKHVGYAYPSSPDAARFRYSRSGCYVVETMRQPGMPGKSICGFPTVTEAWHFAESLPGQFVYWQTPRAAMLQVERQRQGAASRPSRSAQP